jgi:ABC-type multidrug transport system fused ATPase/permease subunit
MLRYRTTVAGAIFFALVSAGSMGAGIVAVRPLLERVLDEDPTSLRELAAEGSMALSARTGLSVPPGLIDLLPGGHDKGAQFNAILWSVCGLALLTVFGALANFLHAYLSLTVVNRSITAIRRECFHRTLRLPLKTIVASGPMDSISRIINDTSSLGTGFNTLLSKALAQVTKGVSALAAAFLIEPRLALIAIGVGLVLGTIIRKLGKSIRRASRSALHSQSDLYRATTEALQGLRVVKVHTTERYEAGRFHRLNKQVMRELNRVRTARAIASPLVETLAIFVLGGLVLVAAKAIIDKALNPADFFMTLVALGAAGASLKPLTGLLNDIQASSAGADRVLELLREPSEPGHGVKLPKLPRHARSIAFDNVTFTYPTAREPSLREVSLTINHGETVAVVGPNGSGKTTLLALVPRLFDAQSGTVSVDGRDIREVGVRSLRAQIGVVTQETVLFQGTIRANIAYGAGAATEEQIVAAAKQARAHEFIARLPRGYDTPVAEQGLSLSGGQRQRIAIARAILRNPAILILDEATSMIDADSEAKIAEAIGEFSHGRTCLIVAHRLSTVLNADRIVVMDQGRIADVGTHRELLARCDVYRQLARHQLLGGQAAPVGQEA